MSTYRQTCICKYAKFKTLKCGGVTFSRSSLDDKNFQALLLTHSVHNYKTWTKETGTIPYFPRGLVAKSKRVVHIDPKFALR